MTTQADFAALAQQFAQKARFYRHPDRGPAKSCREEGLQIAQWCGACVDAEAARIFTQLSQDCTCDDESEDAKPCPAHPPGSCICEAGGVKATPPIYDPTCPVKGHGRATDGERAR